MVKEFHVAGFDSLVEKLDTLKGEHVFIFFTGSPGEDGKSWCPQCVDGMFQNNCKDSDCFISNVLKTANNLQR